MQNHFITIFAAALATMGASVAAYANNCAGSYFSPNLGDCERALAKINTGATYTDQAQFSVGTCYMIYATNGAGPQALSGKTVYDTAQAILDNCGDHKGSFGTDNCESCHVTINYRRS